MPLYDVQCRKCGKVEEIYRTLATYKNTPECCGVAMSHRLTPRNIAADIQPYQSMIDGSMITSRSQHKRHLKANNCIEVGNEPLNMEPPRQKEWDKRTKEAIRREIYQRLDGVRS